MITADSKIKRNDTLVPVEMDDQLSMLNIDTGEYSLLNSVGAEIWHMIKTATPVVVLVDALTEEYEVTRPECERWVLPFLETLYQGHLIDIVE